MTKSSDEYNTLEYALKFVECPACNGNGEYPSPRSLDFISGPFGCIRRQIKCDACNGKGKVKND